MSAAKKPKSSGKLAILQQQVEELTLALQRERADAENIRRRHGEEIVGLRQHVKANVVRELLPVIDNCERLLQHISTNSEVQPLVEGVEKIYKQLQQTLADLGVERIKTANEVFNPHLHEAVSMDGGNGDGLPAGRQIEVVSEELQSGYKLGDEVIRHAMVRVRMESDRRHTKSNKQEEGK